MEAEAVVARPDRRAVLAASLSIFLGACAEEASQIVVVLDADDWAAENIVDFDLTIRGGHPGQLRIAQEQKNVCAIWPRTYALAPEDNDADRVIEVELTGRDFEGVVSARALLKAEYSAGQIELFDFLLTENCRPTAENQHPCTEDRRKLSPLAEMFELPKPSPELEPEIDISFPTENSLYINGPFATSALLRDRSGIAAATIENVHAGERCGRAHRILGPTDTINIEVTNNLGKSTRAVRNIRHLDRFVLSPIDLLTSVTSTRAYVVMRESFEEIELSSGTRRIITEFESPRGAQRLIVGSDTTAFLLRASELTEVDLQSHATNTVPLGVECGASFLVSAAWDGPRRRILLLHDTSPFLRALDPRLGRCTALEQQGAPGGIYRDLTVDAANNRAFVLAGDLVWEYSFVSGNYFPHTCTNGQRLAPAALVFDPLSSKIFVLERESRAIVALDPATDQCSTLSSVSAGSGPQLTSPSNLTVSADGIWAVDPYASTLTRIDRMTGERAHSSAPERVASGPAIAIPSDVEYSEARDEILILSRRTAELIGVDPRTGERRLAASLTDREGRPIGFVEHFAVAPSGDLAAFTFSSTISVFRRTLMTVDLINGERAVAAVTTDNIIPFIDSPRALTIGPDGYMYVVDTGRVAILKVGLLTHERFDVTATLRGGGPPMKSPVDVEYDVANERLLVLDAGLRAILSVDLEDGQREIIATLPDDFPGTALTSFEVSRDGRKIYFTNAYYLGELEVETLQFRAITPNEGASNPPFFAPTCASYDFRREVAFLADNLLNGLYLVDLNNGARVILSR